MIQTQLLKADPPYQIISAAGQVGIQVATLIVTEDKCTEEGYQIDTHSHPVVNYGLKSLAGKTDTVRIGSFYELFSSLKPEGAVWNKVEISDVQVIGLAGITKKIELSEFCSLVPPSTINQGHPVYLPIWDRHSVDCMGYLRWSLSRVGIEPIVMNNDDFYTDKYNRIIVNLQTIVPANMPPMVMVSITSHSSESSGLAIQFPLFESDETINQCTMNIVQSISMLLTNFVSVRGVIFKPISTKDGYYKYLQKIAKRANDEIMVYF